LAQFRVNLGTSIAVGGYANETRVRFEANVSDTDNPDTLYLCVEVQPIGTSFTNTETACGNSVSYTGTALLATVTIDTGLSHGTSYHWQARVKDIGNDYSSWLSYGGNAESAADFTIDTANPSGSTYDGSTVGIDIDYNNGSLSSLSSNWDITDALSGISGYEYSIGTTIGGTDITNWTSNGLGTSITVNSLNLKTSLLYYFNIRATDNAGNQVVISSDGQWVSPTLSFSASPGAVTFDNLNSSNNYTSTKTTTLTTSTNAYNGYEVRAFLTSLPSDNDANTINLFNGGTYASPDEWLGGDRGYGYTSNDASIQGVNIFGGSPCPGGGNPPCYAPFALTAPGDIVADHTATVSGTPIVNENFIVTHRVTVNNTQISGTYTTVIVYSIMARY
jgi:hypothetical protein